MADEILFTIEPRWCAACALLPAKLCRGIAIRSIEVQDILVPQRMQCVRIPMKKLNYDRITTTIEREWLAEIIAGTKKIEYRQIKPYWTKGFAQVSLPFELR